MSCPCCSKGLQWLLKGAIEFSKKRPCGHAGSDGLSDMSVGVFVVGFVQKSRQVFPEAWTTHVDVNLIEAFFAENGLDLIQCNALSRFRKFISAFDN